MWMVFLALLVVPLLAPGAVLAQRWPWGPAGTPGFTRPFAPHPIGPRPFFSRPFHHPSFHRPFFDRPFFDRPFFHRFAFVGIASPVIVYAAPPVFYGPPASVDPPAVYSPPAYPTSPAVYDPSVARTVSIAPPLPPMPSVVEYPSGRYELRGDGMTTPYTWVWVPNPPPFPPPESASGGPASPGPSTSGGPAPARHSQLYRWTDAQGVEYWTARWETVPEQYRAQARQPRAS